MRLKGEKMGINERGVRIKKFSMYFAIFLPVMFFSELLVDNFAKEIAGVNLVMNMLAIPCCVIYYRITKKDNVVLYSMFFISILIESSFQYLTKYEYAINGSVPLLIIFRNMFIMLIIFDFKNIIKKVSKNKKVVFVFFIVINMLLLFTNSIIDNILYSNRIFDYFMGVGTILSAIVVIVYIFKYKKSKEFMEIVFLLSLFLIMIRRLIVYINIVFEWNYINEKMIFLFAFYILLVGLFVESSCLIKENLELENEVRTISQDIKEFQELDKLRMQFFANLSHEIKTPINIMYSGIQLIESKGKIGDHELVKCYKKYEPILKQNCFRIIRLTNNLVDMTKFDSGFMKMNFINVDIVNLVENITMSVVDYVKNKNINITFDTLVEEKIIKCDKDAIERILLNLISNSIKFTGEKENILISTGIEGSYVYIKVKDDGIGIPKENRENIFKVFVQGDKSLNRAREGSGIGLSLVKAIVEKHEGSVECIDCEVGAEIVVKLPDKLLECSEENYYVNISHEKDIVLKINTEFSDIYDLR